MLDLVSEFERKENGYELYIKGLLFEMIACLVRMGIVSKKSNEATSEDMMFLDKLLNYIEQNLQNDISREKAAKFMCMSTAKFAVFFKKTTGQTYKEYINYARVSEAERMIFEGKMRIQQAAFEVGFQSVQTFIRIFKQIKGYTPGLLLHEKGNHT
jgi:AraC-like DNA-binding protein